MSVHIADDLDGVVWVKAFQVSLRRSAVDDPKLCGHVSVLTLPA